MSHAGTRFYYFLKILCIYLSEREREHKQGVLQTEGEEEAGSQRSREPDAGLDPRTLGSCPGLKADA